MDNTFKSCRFSAKCAICSHRVADDLLVVYPDELLHDFIIRMLRHGVGWLPVVRRDWPDKIVEYVRCGNILGTRMRLHEEVEAHSKGPINQEGTVMGFWPIPFFQP
jgi:hypothetical protein